MSRASNLERVRKLLRTFKKRKSSPTSIRLWLKNQFSVIKKSYPLSVVTKSSLFLEEALRRMGLTHNYYLRHLDEVRGKVISNKKRLLVAKRKKILMKRANYLAANVRRFVTIIHPHMALTFKYLTIDSSSLENLEITNFGDYTLGKVMIQELMWQGNMNVFVPGIDRNLIKEIVVEANHHGFMDRIHQRGGYVSAEESEEIGGGDSDDDDNNGGVEDPTDGDIEDEEDSESDTGDDTDDGDGGTVENPDDNDGNKFRFEPPSDEDN